MMSAETKAQSTGSSDAVRWREQYERMKRWYARVTESKSFELRDVDDLYAFFTCCFHFKDWLKGDLRVDPSIWREAESLIDSIVAFRLCADIANGSKHLVINKRVRHSADAHVERLLADSDPPIEPTEPNNEMLIVYADSGAWPALWVAKHCVKAWDTFLEGKGLLP